MWKEAFKKWCVRIGVANSEMEKAFRAGWTAAVMEHSRLNQKLLEP